MANSVLKKIRTIGAVPGTVVFTGEQKMKNVSINYFEYNERELEEEFVTADELMSYHEPEDALTQWYDIHGLHNINVIQEIGTIFKIHPLVLEDVADTSQRPKYEEFDNGHFISFRAMKLNKQTMEIDSQQISIFFGNGFLVSFQEETDKIFESVKNRIRTATGRIRKRGSDYLAYTLIDAVTDRYFTILDELEVFVEETEDLINRNPQNKIKSQIHDMKMELLQMRKNVGPFREAISSFSHSDSELIHEKTKPFLKDVRDHINQVSESVDSYRDSLTGLQELFLSEMSFKMNQVMQVLTVVTTIFIPLSFFTGLYGMNFVNIPELQNENGYFYLLGFMGLIAVLLLYFFKRKNWL